MRPCGIGRGISAHRRHSIITAGVKGISSSEFRQINLSPVERVHLACLFPRCNPGLRGSRADRYELFWLEMIQWSAANKMCASGRREPPSTPCPWADLLLSLFSVATDLQEIIWHTQLTADCTTRKDCSACFSYTYWVLPWRGLGILLTWDLIFFF